jgi:2-polyprenyl-3-methyl-5-hydroxy-6-metoxy-1,4-benzoquinol methylase
MAKINPIIKEDEIRPDILRDEQAKRFASDINRLLKYRAQFQDVSCPACDSVNASKVFTKYELSYVKCSQCETVYINPRPSPDILERYYETSENYAYWNEFIFPASESARREKIFRPRANRLVEICQRFNIKTQTLLEVGAGFGTFCEEVKKLKLFDRVIAVEPTPGLAETCRKKGLDVIEKPIEQIQLKQGGVDVVAAFEVIEHLFSPMNFLKSCWELLAPRGIVVVSCPNIKGFDLVVLQELSETVDVEHLNYFHPDSLSKLFISCGFQILEVTTPGNLDAELVRKKILSGAFDVKSQPFLKQVLVDGYENLGNNFQEFLVQNKLSSHMWLVAQKQNKKI